MIIACGANALLALAFWLLVAHFVLTLALDEQQAREEQP
jgi:hypothetical protein